MNEEDLEVLDQAAAPVVYEFSKKYVEDGQHDIAKKYRGQSKEQFLIRFSGDKNSLKLDTKEIRKIKWVKPKELKKYLMFRGQFEHAQKVLIEFGIL